MSEQTIVIRHQSNKSVSELFAYIADHSNLSSIFGAPITRIKAGLAEPNGIGSVRRIGPPVVGVEETVTAMQPNELIEYRITRNGGPIQNHLGRIEFSEAGSGSGLQWTITFQSPLPLVGPAVKAVLTLVMSRGLKRL